MTRIIIDPASNFYYSSFFVKGLIELYSGKVTFSSKPFSGLIYNEHTHCFSFIIKGTGIIKKVVIDFADTPECNLTFLEWSDLYGKINYQKTFAKANEKIVPVAPNYALKIWSKPVAGLMGLRNYLLSRERTISFYQFISKYLMSAKRMRNFENLDYKTDPKSIFFVSTWWTTQSLTNQFRSNFIRACKSIPEINFAGGLIPETSDLDSSGNEDVIINTSVDYKEYIRNIKRSALVFNTPAYHLSHSWKLPEYLALGKAIISTPLINELPEPLKHLENIYFVSGEVDDIRNAIRIITSDHSLRSKLEEGAFKYFKNFIEPEQAMKKLLWNLTIN